MEVKDKQLLIFEQGFPLVLQKTTFLKNLNFLSLISHFQLIRQSFFYYLLFF